MEEHRFVPSQRNFRVKKKRKIFRTIKPVGQIIDKPDFESMTFSQSLNKMGISGKRTSISTQVFRESIGQLARRNPASTMGISGKFLLHALDSGSIEECAEEVYGIDSSLASVHIDADLTMIALDEAFDRISKAARQGAKIIFASSRPAATLPLLIEIARLSENIGATILQSFDDTSSFIADGRKGRHFSWSGGVAVMSDGESILASNDAKAADNLLFHLPRPDLVVADHIFAGAAITGGYPTIAFAGLESLAVGVASVPENQCLAVPISLSRTANRYSIIANFAKPYFENL